MSKRTILVAVIATLVGAIPAFASDTVYVDLSGIDTAFPDLTAEQRQELKDLIVADMQANFNVAGVDITVTTDSSADADRTVHINDDLGTHQRADGSTGHHYGEWPYGSDECNVHLDNFTDRHGDDYKDADGHWDLDKLRKGIGRTAAHEIAHSYSVGHNGEGDSPNKMTEGGLVSSETRANTEWIFDEHTADVMNENLGEDPCETTADYDEDYLEPVFTWPPLFPNPDWDPSDPNSDPYNDLDEYGNFDGRLLIEGSMAEMLDLGWYGRDTDNGLEDGNPDFDFIYKASMAEATPPDMLTFFEDAHATAQFVLRGRAGSQWEGEWFPMDQALIIPRDPVVTPDGEEIFRLLSLQWDIDQDGFEDVFVTLDSNMLYPWGCEFNGWRIGHAWPCRGDLDYDYDIDLTDLAILLSNYGMPYGALYGDGDLDGDRDVDLTDLAGLLAVYGTVCAGPCEESIIEIEILTDSWPYETTWEITDHDTGALLCSGGPYAAPDTLYTEICCIGFADCVDFTIYDSYGDGIYPPGGYAVSLDGILIHSNIGSGWIGHSAIVPRIGGGCSALEPDFVVDAPYTSPMRSTCGAGDDCSPPSQYYDTEDHTYEVHIPFDAYWTFSLCGSLFDTWLAVGTTLCGEEVGWNDDYCGLQSELTAFITAGTYFVDVESYIDCGDYILEIYHPTVPDCIAAGQDCWLTPFGRAHADFASAPLPSDFFGPGSDPFEGQVALQSGTGFADTIVERLGEMCFEPPDPSSAEVPIEIVELNLVSTEPITVTNMFGEPSYWDVQVNLSVVPVDPGVLTATRTHEEGGTFTAEFYLQPRYRFTRVDNPGEVRIWDTGVQGQPPILMRTVGEPPWSIDETYEFCTFEGWSAGVMQEPTGETCGVEVCFDPVDSIAFAQCAVPANWPLCAPFTPVCGACGPGAHWVDMCMAGMDYAPAAAWIGIDLNFDCMPDSTLLLAGTTVVARSEPRDDSLHFPGLRPIDGHLDVIDTEILELNLTDGGATLLAGAGQGHSGLLAPSLGACAEDLYDDFPAESFFDVYFELDLPDGQQLYNQLPVSLGTVILCAPPDEVYMLPPDCVPLYTSPIPGQGEHVANLITLELDSYDQ
jgi:hypothetical protein